VLLFAQANGTDLGQMMHPNDHLNIIASNLQCPIYAFDYSGYGCSTGRPSEKNVYSDIRAVYDRVREANPTAKVFGYKITRIFSDIF
jgi:hypothetical protein